MKKQWLFALIAFGIISILGILFPFSFNTGDTSGIDSGDTAWMLASTALVFLMTPGLGFFYGGMVKPKNVISTILQSFIAMGLISILWVVFGFSLAFGESIGGEGYGFFGNPATFFMFRGVGGAPDPNFAARGLSVIISSIASNLSFIESQSVSGVDTNLVNSSIPT